MGEKDYYDTKLSEIKSLVSKKNYAKAKFLIDEELRVVYIPRHFESELKKLGAMIRDLSGNETTKNMRMSRDEVTDFLNSDSRAKAALALEQMADLNLHLLKPEITKFFSKNFSGDTIEKAYLFELLIAQSVDINLTINNQVLNPSRFISPLTLSGTKSALTTIHSALEKSPNVLEVASALFNKYILIKYFSLEALDSSFVDNFLRVVVHFFDANKALENAEQRKIFELLSSF